MAGKWIEIVADGKRYPINIQGWNAVSVIVYLKPENRLTRPMQVVVIPYDEPDEPPSVKELDEQWATEPYDPC